MSESEINSQGEIYTDLYIINKNSHNIFYVSGIAIDGETYYTNYTPNDVDKINMKLEPTGEDDGQAVNTGYGIVDVIWLDGKTNTPSNPQIPNSPEKNLKDMQKVTWTYDETKKVWEEDNTSSSNWYNYKAKTDKNDNQGSYWANAKNTDGSYFVWIPRYAYRITYYESQEAWKNGANPTGYYDGYGMWSYDATTGTGSKKLDLDSGIETCDYAGRKYIVHPAFGTNIDNGGWQNELEGFWVAKYEMSMEKNGATFNTSADLSGNVYIDEANKALGNDVTDTIQAKSIPGVKSWRKTYIGYCYTNAKYYDRNKESHLVKNSEWGAVAYLTHSQYGRNGYEVDINNSSDYITGNGGGSTDAEANAGVTNAYNTEIGQKSSSTGNVYGVYDLSGGSSEYVAAYNSSDANNYENIYGSSFASINLNSDKYASKYKNDSGVNYGDPTIYNVSKVGDAIKEIWWKNGEGYKSYGWFSDYIHYADKNFPFYTRGGSRSESPKSEAGIFYSNNVKGFDHETISFRVTLCP